MNNIKNINKKIIFLIMGMVILLITSISALQVDIPIPANYSEVNTNHSLTSDYATSAGTADYWDSLDTPADILGSLINNDLS